MPKVDNRFAGHMETGDPRTPVFVARGCVWPTVPALKYRAQSDNASGSMRQLNGDGLLLELLGWPPDHDVGIWQYTAAVGDIEFINLTKVQDPGDGLGYHWRIDVKIRSDIGTVIANVFRPNEKCNRDTLVGNMVALGPSVGESGDSFSMNQVEWDKLLPPD